MSEDDGKRAAGYAAVERYVRDGMCIGLGTGSTARWAVEAVGERVARGERFVAIPTSHATEEQCRGLNIPLAALGDRPIEVAIDGADEVDETWELTKGGGGALFREKAVALAAAAFVVVATPEKLVHRLGAFATPVEVVPFSLPWVRSEIAKIFPGAKINRRGGETAPFVTDNGNALLDVSFGSIDDPMTLDGQLRGLHGVVATGLFAGLTSAVFVGESGGVRELTKPG